jgi:hypothetical protein|tara:strand:+ start:201 stop:431 length:231 start_codon:yes stop_codon:yes gene_type:complete
MKKEEIVTLIENLHPEDKQGNIEAIFIGRHGEVIKTDSIRLDMDGGRLIIVQEGTSQYTSNKENWEQELEFCRNMQ